ncbi:MAG TPA: DUF2147 domain-containing protein [Phenylobacterium sp.]|jgi:uncharacterized protein (DUF2147 family)|uniref:DUF2147 domain-containing protein n=1 Tax=Phenylobacterium sp. TaxID=1871053 RepID=UPI002D3E18A3|nr:DUF2147 domain-containing protein [Phenylobacterium sp.]HZZ68651.1 DUF2147 domain-containing protein [Phenylobacterium sp.]
MKDSIRGMAATAAVLLAAIAPGHAALAAAGPDPAFGVWLTRDGDAKVRIGPCTTDPAEACGTIAWLRSPDGDDGKPRRDTVNSNPALKGRPLLGMPLLEAFHRTAVGRWVDGKIYDPEDGRTFRSKMSAQPNGTLKVSGCVLMFCAGQSWQRVG